MCLCTARVFVCVVFVFRFILFIIRCVLLHTFRWIYNFPLTVDQIIAIKVKQVAGRHELQLQNADNILCHWLSFCLILCTLYNVFLFIHIGCFITKHNEKKGKSTHTIFSGQTHTERTVWGQSVGKLRLGFVSGFCLLLVFASNVVYWFEWIATVVIYRQIDGVDMKAWCVKIENDLRSLQPLNEYNWCIRIV